MEDLFWTTLSLDGREQAFHIIFENELYCFIPKGASKPAYCFRRAHDEWKGADEASEKVSDKAVEALEKYLLRQH